MKNFSILGGAPPRVPPDIGSWTLPMRCLFPFCVFFVHQRRNGIHIIILHMFLHPFPLNTYTRAHINA